MIGDGLERQLALDLEHVADVVEDPREVAVRQLAVGLVVLVVRPQVSVGKVKVGGFEVGGFEVGVVGARRRPLDVRLLDGQLGLAAGVGRRIGAGGAAGHGRDGTRDAQWPTPGSQRARDVAVAHP